MNARGHLQMSSGFRLLKSLRWGRKPKLLVFINLSAGSGIFQKVHHKCISASQTGLLPFLPTYSSILFLSLPTSPPPISAHTVPEDSCQDRNFQVSVDIFPSLTWTVFKPLPQGHSRHLISYQVHLIPSPSWPRCALRVPEVGSLIPSHCDGIHGLSPGPRRLLLRNGLTKTQ